MTTPNQQSEREPVQITPVGIAAYPKLHGVIGDKGETVWETMMMFSQQEAQPLMDMWHAMAAKEFPGVGLHDLKGCYKVSDTVKGVPPGYICFTFRSRETDKNRTAPEIVNWNLERIDPRDIQPGNLIQIAYRPFAFNSPKNGKGISLWMYHVQLRGLGTPMQIGVKPTDVFQAQGELVQGAQQPPTHLQQQQPPAQQPYQPPAQQAYQQHQQPPAQQPYQPPAQQPPQQPPAQQPPQQPPAQQAYQPQQQPPVQQQQQPPAQQQQQQPPAQQQQPPVQQQQPQQQPPVQQQQPMQQQLPGQTEQGTPQQVAQQALNTTTDGLPF